MVNFDDGLMYLAIHPINKLGGEPENTGYLNRKDGEIIFVYENDEDAELHMDDADGAENAANRAKIAAAPEEWVEIPRMICLPVHHEHWCDRRTVRPRRYETPCTCGAEEKAQSEEETPEAFMHAFLEKEGVLA
jgi:hypothetical protein